MSASLDHVFEPRPSRRLLHILNGDATREPLERSSVPGTFSVWADAFHEGPVPSGISIEQRREVRVRFWTDQDMGAPYEREVARYQGWDEGLASFGAYDEVVLWFEHDLFDQLLLIHHLDYYGRREMGDTRLSLICIGEYPGFERFHGLGELNPDQLASLLDTRQPVTPEQLDLGRAAWAAFTAPDPTALDELARADTRALPFLEGALTRFLEEYPSVRNGLPRAERQILGALAVRGPMAPGDLFVATYPLEERVFMGDSIFWARVLGLAAGPHPLVDCDVVEREGRLPRGTVRITETGRAVLDGRSDAVALNGIDRWLGGVHLHGAETEWRWDEVAGRLRRRDRDQPAP